MTNINSKYKKKFYSGSYTRTSLKECLKCHGNMLLDRKLNLWVCVRCGESMVARKRSSE